MYFIDQNMEDASHMFRFLLASEKNNVPQLPTGVAIAGAG
jgi:hypothetical protein